MLDGVECNIDDVLVHASTQELNDKRLEQVLKRMIEAGVTLNVDKCTFRVPKIKFLGNVLSTDMIEVDPDKVSALVKPTSTQECPWTLCFPGDGKPLEQVRSASGWQD